MTTAALFAGLLFCAVASAEPLSCPAGTRLLEEVDGPLETAYCARPVESCPERAERRRKLMGKRGASARIYPEKAGRPNYLIFLDNGTWACFLPHGPARKIIQGGESEIEENFVDGVLEGAAVTRRGGVKVEEKNYKNGELDGVSTRWLEDGRKFSEETFKKGVRSGPFSDWADDGKLMMQGTWVPAGLDGRFTRWDADGKKEFELEFKQGRLTKILRQRKASGPLNIVIEHPHESSEPDTCYGIAPKELAEQQSELAYGAACAHGDFDGNGTEDVAINVQDSEASFSAVYLLDPSKILAYHRLPGSLWLYRSDEPGLFGEPATKTDGLVEWGEGGTTRVYLYDPAAKSFKKSEHASEDR